MNAAKYSEMAASAAGSAGQQAVVRAMHMANAPGGPAATPLLPALRANLLLELGLHVYQSQVSGLFSLRHLYSRSLLRSQTEVQLAKHIKPTSSYDVRLSIVSTASIKFSTGSRCE